MPDDDLNPAPAPAEPHDLADAGVVLSLLEADQVVAVKQRTRFGRRPLSRRLRILLWALRIYLLLMLVIVAISVCRAL